jgi:hypothetical protein
MHTSSQLSALSFIVLEGVLTMFSEVLLQVVRGTDS